MSAIGPFCDCFLRHLSPCHARWADPSQKGSVLSHVISIFKNLMIELLLFLSEFYFLINMDNFLQSIYLEQAKEECESCFECVILFNNALQSGGTKELFDHVMNFINRVAAVSRIFWPTWCKDKNENERAQKRGRLLREVLSLGETHAIKNKTLRNHLEHFDARLDEWAEKSRNRNIIKKFIGPRSAIGGGGIDDGDIIHHYDYENKIYSFRGEKFSLQELANGIDDIYSRVQTRLNQIEKERFGASRR